MGRKNDLINLMASALEVSIRSMANYDADALEYAKVVMSEYMAWRGDTSRLIPTPEQVLMRQEERRRVVESVRRRPSSTKRGSWLA